MIKYRLRFKFQKESDATINRENSINDIISDVDSIVSDVPIRKPLDGEIILISGEEYKVVSTMIAFEKDGEDTFYDLVVLLKSTTIIKKEKKEEEEEMTKDHIRKLYEEAMNEYTSKKSRYKESKYDFDDLLKDL